jgi:hypothetical protein
MARADLQEFAAWLVQLPVIVISLAIDRIVWLTGAGMFLARADLVEDGRVYLRQYPRIYHSPLSSKYHRSTVSSV